ncbi:MAG: hypothetical protein AAGI46_12825 [Planctomycetota bacterium]
MTSGPNKQRAFGTGFLIKALAVAFVAWVILGLAAPLVTYWLIPGMKDHWAGVGPIGDLFGVANSFFSACALLGVLLTLLQQNRSLEQQQESLTQQRASLDIQNRELRQSVEAQKQTADNHKRALAAEVLLPLMSESRDGEMGESRQRVASFFRHEDAASRFRHMYLRSIRKEDGLSDVDSSLYETLDDDRRKIKLLIMKVFQLRDQEIVPNDDLARLVISVTAVGLVKFALSPIEKILINDPGYNPPWISWTLSLYDAEDVDRYWNRGNR